jgi:hypothetical protein
MGSFPCGTKAEDTTGTLITRIACHKNFVLSQRCVVNSRKAFPADDKVFDGVESILVCDCPLWELFLSAFCCEWCKDVGMLCEIGEEGGDIMHETEERVDVCGVFGGGPVEYLINFRRVCFNAALGDVMTEEIHFEEVKFTLLGVEVQTGISHCL